MKYCCCALAVIAILAQIQSASAAEIIVVQAGGVGTTQTGSWDTSWATMPYNGNPGVYTAAGNNGTYTFAPTFPQTATYAVEVYNTCYTPRSHNVTHVIKHAGGSTAQIVEQDCQLDPYVGQWRPLGSYTFNAGNTGGLTIYSAGSSNHFVGATAVRFIYTPSGNTPPTITPSTTLVNVNEGGIVALTASANDAQDGNLTSAIQWQTLGQTGTGANFSVRAGAVNFVITLSVTDSQGASSTASVSVVVTPNTPPPPPTQGQFYGFDCQILEPLTGFTTNNASALPNVGKRCGRYTAELLTNDNNVTLHYNNDQGRFDGVLATFPFTAIVRNVGIAPIGQPDVAHVVPTDAINLAGIQIHHSDLNNRNSAHVVVGQRGVVQNTIEGKMTRDGVSDQSDIGQNQLPRGRADIRVVGATDGTLLVYWQQANLTGNSNNDNWIPYNGSGHLPGRQPVWGQTVYVGLITYAYGTSGLPFMGLVDSLEIIPK